jgi:hypothetical protein
MGRQRRIGDGMQEVDGECEAGKHRVILAAPACADAAVVADQA